MLAHGHPGQVAESVELITGADPDAWVVLHYDANSPPAEYGALTARLAANERAVLVDDRVRCSWGKFELVEAALNGLRAMRERGISPDYVYLISGSCLPIRPLAELNRFLDEHAGTEFIEVQDEKWVTGGLRLERFRYYFPFGFQQNRTLFDYSVKLQRRMRVNRRFFGGLQPRFGSQWWCLTWQTCQAILDYVIRNPGVIQYFRMTWIPDESFFQTLVHHLATPELIADKTLTLYKFGATGKPVVFFDDHESWLFSQNFFFARKVSSEAIQVKQKAAEIARAPDRGKPTRGIGRVTPFYDAAIWLRATQEPPGQLYRADQGRDRYPGALGRNRKPYIVLFGPTVATDVAAEALRRYGLQIFGRLFHPERVDLGRETLPGLGPDDRLVRDYDPSLYLVRVLARSQNCPVYQQTIWDNPKAAYLAHDDPNCLFVACLPRTDVLGTPHRWGDQEWQLYFSLALSDADERATELDSAWGDIVEAVGDHRLFGYQQNDTQWGELLAWARNKGLVGEAKENLLVLPWGGGASSRVNAVKLWESVQKRWKHGDQFPAGAMEAAITALSEFGLEEAMPKGPSAARSRRSEFLAISRLPPGGQRPPVQAEDARAEVGRLRNAVP